MANPAFVRNLAFTKLYLGDAYTAAGAAPEAATAIGDAAALAAHNRSARLVEQLWGARDRLKHCRAPTVVQNLDEQLHAYGLR